MFKKFFSRVKTSDADDDISVAAESGVTIVSHNEHIFKETLGKEIVISIATYLPLSDLNNFARTDQFLLLLFFNLSTGKVNAISKRKQELAKIDIETRIVSVKDQYKEDEKVTTVQQFIWKPLVFHYFPNYSRSNLNIKNWMHVLRRRVIHLQNKFPTDLPLSKIIKSPPAESFDDLTYRENANRQFIENCEWEYQCPLKFSVLTAISPQVNGNSEVIFCEVCKENVYEVKTENEFVSHVEQGHCVAFSKYLLERGGERTPERDRVVGKMGYSPRHELERYLSDYFSDQK